MPQPSAAELWKMDEISRSSSDRCRPVPGCARRSATGHTEGQKKHVSETETLGDKKTHSTSEISWDFQVYHSTPGSETGSRTHITLPHEEPCDPVILRPATCGTYVLRACMRVFEPKTTLNLNDTSQMKLLVRTWGNHSPHGEKIFCRCPVAEPRSQAIAGPEQRISVYMTEAPA